MGGGVAGQPSELEKSRRISVLIVTEPSYQAPFRVVEFGWDG